jgi:SOS-response transcriptional repressor LexA
MTATGVASTTRHNAVASRHQSNIDIVSKTIHKLHPTQRAIYRKIVSFMRAHDGLAPTRHEIASGLGIAEGAYIRYHLLRIEAAGLIVLEPRVRRGIRLAEPPAGPSAPAAPESSYDWFISQWGGA